MKGKISVTFNFPNRSVTVELREDEAFCLLTEILGVNTDSRQTTSTKMPPIPDTDELTEKIKDRPQFEFSLEDIAEEYLHDYPSVSKDDKNKWTNALRAKLGRIRNNIASEENGTWLATRDGKSKIYTFVRNE